MCAECAPSSCGGQKRTVDSLELELGCVSNLSCGCWESNLGPLHEQQVLWTTEPSLWSLRPSLSLYLLWETGSYNIDWTGLELRYLLASASWELGLKVCATKPQPVRYFKSKKCNCHSFLFYTFYWCHHVYTHGVWSLFETLHLVPATNSGSPISASQEHVTQSSVLLSMTFKLLSMTFKLNECQ